MALWQILTCKDKASCGSSPLCNDMMGRHPISLQMQSSDESWPYYATVIIWWVVTSYDYCCSRPMGCDPIPFPLQSSDGSWPSRIIESCVNESCPMSMWHVAYEWGMSHANSDSRRILMSHVTYTYDGMWWCVFSQMTVNVWMGMYMHTNEVFFSTYAFDVWYMNESCHLWMSHVTYEWVMSHKSHACLCVMKWLWGGYGQ